MLAILLIEMECHKGERGSAGARLRQKYCQPIPIAEGVSLAGDGVFVVKCEYYQRGDTILSSEDALARLQRKFPQMESLRIAQKNLQQEALRSQKKSKKKPGGQVCPITAQEPHAFTASDEPAHWRAMHQKESIRKSQGAFYDAAKLDIPCVSFFEEPENAWRVRWYDDGRGMPRRRGGNEQCYERGAKLAGRVNTLNETAFFLKPGEAGVLKYNYRFTSYEGQWYKCYYTYVVNAKMLTREVFLREYDYTYEQMADLF